MHRSDPGITHAWLVRLRWATALCQTVAILAAARLLPGAPEPAPLLALVGFGAASNVVLAWRLKRPAPLPASLPGLVLGLDILILTGLLRGSGGPANPFTVAYLVHVTLAAVVLRGPWAWSLGLLAAASYGLLFVSHVPVHALGHMDHGDGISVHLVGMWVAFALAAGLIAYFVGRVSEALRRREGELAALHDLHARETRLAALATLAAGVAHELGSPLGTIAVAAKELQRSVAGLGPAAASVVQDATLIRAEVDRCRKILDQLADPSGDTPGEQARAASWPEIQEALESGLAAPERERLAFIWPAEGPPPLPVAGLARAVRALVSNALEATREGGRVRVRAWRESGRWSLEVEDEGLGMAPEVLARAGEPFFTTRPVGAGMGLGVFLARAFAEQLGGSLVLDSTRGRGTTARLSWPPARHD